MKLEFLDMALTALGGRSADPLKLNEDASSQPLIGKDILRRMNQLEKKSRLSATVSLPTTLLPPKKSDDLQDKAKTTALKSAMARSKTIPEPATDTVASQKSHVSGRERSNGRDSRDRSSSPICRSPTWSLKDRDKAKRSNHEEKGSKHEKRNEEKHNTGTDQAPSSARKRLSKRPPAAMETQGFSFGRRSTTPESTSGRSSRRSSFSEPTKVRRSSISSLTSTLRFPNLLRRNGSSQPPTPLNGSSSQDFETARHKSQQASNSSILTKYSSGDEAYVTDLVDFACEMGMSAQKALEADVARAKTVQQRRSATLTPRSESSNPSTRAKTKSVDSQLNATTEDRVVKRYSEDANIKPVMRPGKQDNAVGGYKYPNFKKPSRKQKANTVNVASPSPVSRTLQNLRSQSAPSVPMAQSYGVAGSASYVQRHRLTHEQRSIARLEDELAVTKATEAIYNSPAELPRQRESLPSLLKSGEPTRTQKEVVPAVPSGVNAADSQPLRNVSKKTSRIYEQTPNSIVSNEAQVRPKEAEAHSESAMEPILDNAKPKEPEKPVAKIMSDAKLDLQSKKSEESKATSGDDDVKSAIYQSADTFQLLPLQNFTTSPTSQVFSIDEPFQTSLQSSVDPKVDSAQGSEIQKEPVTRDLNTKEDDNSEKAIVRRPSARRPRSDTELNVQVEKRNDPAPDSHPGPKPQSLIKPKRGSKVSFALPDDFQDKSSLPSPKSAPAVRTSFGLPLPTFGRPPSSSSLSSTPTFASSNYATPAGSLSNKPTAKLFIICCKCQRWHDLPSKVYEAMALPKSFFKSEMSGKSIGNGENDVLAPVSKNRIKSGLEGKVFTEVKCPWCEHGMSTSCCAGWTAIVYMHEKHH